MTYLFLCKCGKEFGTEYYMKKHMQHCKDDEIVMDACFVLFLFFVLLFIFLVYYLNFLNLF